MQRDSQTFESFVRSASEGTPLTHVFIDANTLMQSGLGEQVASLSPSVAAQLPDAVQTGGSISVPVEEYLSKVGSNQDFNPLLEHLRTNPTGFSKAEAAEWQTNHAAELREQTERLLNLASQDATFKDSAAVVKQRILTEINAASTQRKDINDSSASVIAAYYAARAAQLGMTPEALYDKRPLKFEAGGIADGLNQALKGALPKGWRTGNGKVAAAMWRGHETADAVRLDIKAKKLAGDIPGSEKYSHSVSQFALKHIRDQHGNEKAETRRGQIAINDGDIESIPAIIENYDAIRTDLVSDRGNPVVAYAKRTGDGVVVYLEEVGRKRMDFTALSMWKYPAATDAQSILQRAVTQSNVRNDGGHELNLTEPREENKLYQSADELVTETSFASTAEAYGGEAAYQEAKKARKTNLNYRQWVQVRTPEFKAWFGDWENDPANASKVVDPQTGEPRVVYHGTKIGNKIESFDPAKLGKNTGAVSAGKGFFFAGDRGTSLAYSFGSEEADADAKIDQENWQAANEAKSDLAGIVGLVDGALADELSGIDLERRRNLERDPWDIYNDALNALDNENEPDSRTIKRQLIQTFDRFEYALKTAESFSEGMWQATLNDEYTFKQGRMYELFLNIRDPNVVGFDGYSTRQKGGKLNRGLDTAKSDGYDGFIGENVRDGAGETTIFVAFDPNQIKSATRNAGTFDPENPNILYQSNSSPRGAFSPQSLTISLFNGADASTFIHEGVHFFFENDITLAGELMRDAKVFGMDTLSTGEKQILADVSALFTKHGITGDIESQLAQWANMDPEERRSYHEQTARWGEQYFMEGKSPSLELSGYFQKFSAWLKNVYRSIKDFLAMHPESGKLSDDVRQVFDRMLATTEQIQMAEQGRSLMPLFETAEQSGMNAEEYAAYQKMNTDATATAIDELQVKSLKDMKWMAGAKSKMIRNLQKQAKGLRDGARIDATREIMKQPVYQAWRFLTGKLNPSDQFNPAKPRTSDPVNVDPSIDSLFTAIAKLGGINQGEAVSAWGVDPEDRPRSESSRKPVLRKKGGLSLDDILESLDGYGYLSHDESGRPDVRELEAKFFEELGGNTQYSNAYEPEGERRAGDEVVNPAALEAGRLDMDSLEQMYLGSEEIVNVLKARRMTSKSGGLHPDIVAEMIQDQDGNPLFSSGDEMVRKLAAATPMNEAIDALTDQLMIERHAELSSPEAIERAAEAAILNDVRARFVTTEANALAKAFEKKEVVKRGGKERRVGVVLKAAKEYAAQAIGRVRVRDVRPGMYTKAEVRAAKAAEKAFKSGDIATAAAEKRNQVIQQQLAKAAMNAQDETARGIRYLRSFSRKKSGLAIEYREQIDALLERFDLVSGNKKADRNANLAAWIQSQVDNNGVMPDIQQKLQNEAFRTSYRNLTMEDFRGLVESVKQIEHLGRLKNRLLTAKTQRDLEKAVEEIVAGIYANAKHISTDQLYTSEIKTLRDQAVKFVNIHKRAGTIALILDGGKEGGVIWEAPPERGELFDRFSQNLLDHDKFYKMGNPTGVLNMNTLTLKMREEAWACAPGLG